MHQMREGVAFRASPVPPKGLTWIDSVEKAGGLKAFLLCCVGCSSWCRWARLWKLLLLVGFIVGLVTLGSLGVIDTVKQVQPTFHVRFCCLARFRDLVLFRIAAVACLVRCFDGAMRTGGELVLVG